MQEVLFFKTSKKEEVLDITPEVKDIVSKSGIKDGLCVVYAKHATAAVIINENYDPNVCVDIINCLDKMIPQGKWLHDNVDGNAAAHIKSSILGPSETVPVKAGKLQLGTWQSIMLCDFDGPRNREVVVQILEGK